MTKLSDYKRIIFIFIFVFIVLFLFVYFEEVGTIVIYLFLLFGILCQNLLSYLI